MNSIENNNINSLTMDLENLQLKYTNLLDQYKSAVYEYTNFLSQPENKSQLVSIKGYAFDGTGIAGPSKSTNLQDCQAECAKLSKCTGATFVSDKCSLRTGDSPIVSSSDDSYAIIPKSKQLLLNMENINKQLIAVNREILNKFETSEPILNKNNIEASKNSNNLANNYKNLLAERDNILDLLSQYETLDSSENENQIRIKQNYYSYILLLILATSILFLLYKLYSQVTPSNTSGVQYGGKLGVNAYYIIFFMVLLIAGIQYL
jgi:hypothetical protein